MHTEPFLRYVLPHVHLFRSITCVPQDVSSNCTPSLGGHSQHFVPNFPSTEHIGKVRTQTFLETEYYLSLMHEAHTCVQFSYAPAANQSLMNQCAQMPSGPDYGGSSSVWDVVLICDHTPAGGVFKEEEDEQMALLRSVFAHDHASTTAGARTSMMDPPSQSYDNTRSYTNAMTPLTSPCWQLMQLTDESSGAQASIYKHRSDSVSQLSLRALQA
jgi:hypothetical protein